MSLAFPTLKCCLTLTTEKLIPTPTVKGLPAFLAQTGLIIGLSPNHDRSCSSCVRVVTCDAYQQKERT